MARMTIKAAQAETARLFKEANVQPGDHLIVVHADRRSNQPADAVINAGKDGRTAKRIFFQEVSRMQDTNPDRDRQVDLSRYDPQNKSFAQSASVHLAQWSSRASDNDNIDGDMSPKRYYHESRPAGVGTREARTRVDRKYVHRSKHSGIEYVFPPLPKYAQR